ncbi:hypothetical protein PV08_05814 [Exophiala spinifera]|uniref:Uncharacterized protein n=1 Tax=Exophiala spinifera TaxID=91928 RepID=A0A0D2BWT1_9EURO|nr:uncharacterized protein PV08_05814 [Exophiala spinifera]KIW15764.1 hypothetical protein PV08_05814 [Exophiala spinifera]
MHSLPLSLSYRKFIHRLNVAILAKRSRSSRLEVYNPMLLGRLTSQMQTTFPNLHGITLTLCILGPKNPPEYYNCRTCVLPDLALNSFWNAKISGINLQMGAHYTVKICELTREALEHEFGWMYELPALRWIDIYCQTALSHASYNTWVAGPGELTARSQRVQRDSTRIRQQLRMERAALGALVEALPVLLPNLSINIYRKSTWRTSVVSYEPLDLNTPEETIIPRLMRDRTIGAE